MILILEKDSKRADLLEQLVKGTEKYDVTTLSSSRDALTHIQANDDVQLIVTNTHIDHGEEDGLKFIRMLLLKYQRYNVADIPPIINGEWTRARGRPGRGAPTSPSQQLAAGKHKFAVRTMNRHGGIDSTPAVHAFVVEAPWWQNPIVIGLTIVLVGLVGVQSGRLVRRDRRLRESNAAPEPCSKTASTAISKTSKPAQTIYSTSSTRSSTSPKSKPAASTSNRPTST